MNSEPNDAYLNQVKDEIRAQAQGLSQRPLLARSVATAPAAADAVERDRLQYRVGELTDRHYIEFVDHAFRAILKRAPEAAETQAQLHLLGTGASKPELLGNLRWSAEGRRVGTRIAGLLPRYMLAKAARVPVLGYLLQWGLAFASLPLLVRHLRAVETLTAATGHTAAESARALVSRTNELISRIDELDTRQGRLHERLDGEQARTDALIEAVRAVELALRGRIESLEATAQDHDRRFGEELALLRHRIYTIQHWSHRLDQAITDVEAIARRRTEALSPLAARAADAAIRADTARGARNAAWAEQLAHRLPAQAEVLALACGRDWPDLLSRHGLHATGADDAPARAALRRCADHAVDGLSVLALPVLTRTLSAVEFIAEAARVLRPGGILLLALAREPDALVDGLLGVAPAHVPLDLLECALAAEGFTSIARADAADGTPALFARAA